MSYSVKFSLHKHIYRPDAIPAVQPTA